MKRKSPANWTPAYHVQMKLEQILNKSSTKPNRLIRWIWESSVTPGVKCVEDPAPSTRHDRQRCDCFLWRHAERERREPIAFRVTHASGLFLQQHLLLLLQRGAEREERCRLGMEGGALVCAAQA